MTTLNEKIINKARSKLGMKEIGGAAHNPEIVAMFAAVGHSWVKDDETPWCAAFVGAVLAECGLKGTGKLNARSYQTWGNPVVLQKAIPGDVVVLHRNGVNSPFGHVGFLLAKAEDNADRISLLGGNQGDAVSAQLYPISRIVAIRRVDDEDVDAGAPKPNEPATPRHMTLGEYRVGVDFNPSADPTVTEIKAQAARLIDLALTLGNRPGARVMVEERKRLAERAAQQIEEAAMNAVKAATKRPRPE